MAMVSWSKLSYARRLFLQLLAYSALLTGCFLLFQYHRERQFKTSELNSQLQLINAYILQELADGDSLSLRELNSVHPFPDLRVSVIDSAGAIIYDNSLDSLPQSNHLSRREIREAIRTGSGYSARRHSESTGTTYFYSARRGKGGMIVRTAVPYSQSLSQNLQADYGFLWVMCIVAAAMAPIGYFASRRAALHEQQEKERLKKQLTNNINHELKTPVTSIRVCLETILNHPNMSDEKRNDFLRRSLANTDRLQHLLADVALITRMEDGGDTVTMEPLDLAEIIREVADECRPAAEARGMTIRAELPDGPMPLTGNRGLIESVFRNLIDNAIAYSGGRTIDIRLLPPGRRDREWELEVTDDGTGVAPEHLPRLFERFYRIDKGRSRAIGGTGLGLSIVKNAMLLHGGSITVSNLPDGGLGFTLRFKKS